MPLESINASDASAARKLRIDGKVSGRKTFAAYCMSGIESSVWIGEPPRAIRYKKWQEISDANGAFELALESDGLVHTETGDKPALKIFIADYISGLNHANGNIWLTVEFGGEESEIEALKKSIAQVIDEYNFRSLKATLRRCWLN